MALNNMISFDKNPEYHWRLLLIVFGFALVFVCVASFLMFRLMALPRGMPGTEASLPVTLNEKALAEAVRIQEEKALLLERTLVNPPVMIDPGS